MTAALQQLERGDYQSADRDNSHQNSVRGCLYLGFEASDLGFESGDIGLGCNAFGNRIAHGGNNGFGVLLVNTSAGERVSGLECIETSACHAPSMGFGAERVKERAA